MKKAFLPVLRFFSTCAKTKIIGTKISVFLLVFELKILLNNLIMLNCLVAFGDKKNLVLYQVILLKKIELMLFLRVYCLRCFVNNL